MNNTIAARNIDRVIRVGSEGLFSNDGIIDKVLSDGVTVSELLSSQAGQIRGRDVLGGNESGDDVHLEDSGVHRAPEQFVRFQSGIGGGEDGEGSGSGELGGDSGGFEEGDELSKVFVSLEVGFFLAHGDSVGSPDLAGALEGAEGADDVSSSAAG